jgi:tetratricopeptide (TPR) repeat protein
MDAGKQLPPIDMGTASAEVWVERAHEVLRELFRRAGPGSLERTEKAIGVAKGSFSKWRRRGELDVWDLGQALKVLGVEPGLFWLEVCGPGFDPVAAAKRPFGAPRDPVVRRALERWEAAEPGPSKRIGDEELEELDGWRDRDPKQGVRKARSALRRAERRQIPRLLAIYGSARRVEARLDNALEALQWALAMAESGDAGASECADILQRLGVAWAFTGNHSMGLLFAREAEHQYVLAGDDLGKGRCLVDQGTRYAHLDRPEEGIGCYHAALRCLPSDAADHCFAACQSLAVAYQRQGAQGEALEWLRRAEELAPKVGPRLSALLLVTKAEILTAQGDHRQAERCYAAAVEIYRPLSPIDAALGSVELVRAQLRGGRVDRARETVEAMRAFLEPLKGNKVARRAIDELVRLARSGEEITLLVLDRVALELGRRIGGGDFRRAIPAGRE